MKILVTGVAGFIGSFVAQKLLADGFFVVGIDNLNDYYDVQLKLDRLALLRTRDNFVFEKIDLVDEAAMEKLFRQYQIKHVIHLAAQAGVRYSLTNANAYAHSNLNGFLSVLERCRHNEVQLLMYASSSSVYGTTDDAAAVSESDTTDSPLSLYAATKKANEVMASSYGNMFGLKSIGMRFFSVYGPWGRPDMALFRFADSILSGRPIDVYNFGNARRDLTYIDDTVAAIVALFTGGLSFADGEPNSIIYNIARGAPVELKTLIEILESELGRKAVKNYLPLQKGDVVSTHADISKLSRDCGIVPRVSIEEGVHNFVSWYLQYREGALSLSQR